MLFSIALTIYRLVLPLLFIAAFPGWIIKMLRRGGFGTDLAERVGLYSRPLEYEPCGAVHVHAVSVGESFLALKLIREWLQHSPDQLFILATGTATGHAVASAAQIPNLRVTYSPLDFRWMVRRYLARFEPSQIVLIEGEAWPHLLLECRKAKIRVSLVNARMSPRSSRRYSKFASIVRPLFGMLDTVAVQESDDVATWQNLGVSAERIHNTGSLKFDPGSGSRPPLRKDLKDIISLFGENRPVILAASTHAGEDAFIAAAIRSASPHALPVIVPRHAERRAEVTSDLEKIGFHVVLRSDLTEPRPASCLVVDTTGELRDWTTLADVVIIGKSFLSTGGQNPCEAILAEKPLIFGPHMENFQPLARLLLDTGACLVARDSAELSAAIVTALDPEKSAKMTKLAMAQLVKHSHATARIFKLLSE